MQPVMQMHLDVVKGLSNYYFTFVDVMMFKVPYPTSCSNFFISSFFALKVSFNYNLFY